MTRDEVLALLARRQGAMQSRDLAVFADLYASTCRLDSPLAGSVTGLDAIVSSTKAFFTAFPDALLVEEAPVIDGDRAAVAGQVTGTHTGGMLGLPATGRTFQFQMVFLFEFDAGRIVRERRIYDFTGLLVQIGVLTAKPTG